MLLAVWGRRAATSTTTTRGAATVHRMFVCLRHSCGENICTRRSFFAFSAIISGYHFGIENNLFDELSTCINNSLDISNKSKLLESLNQRMPVNCKDATFKILGVSLAAINTILSVLIVVFSIRTLTYEKN